MFTMDICDRIQTNLDLNLTRMLGYGQGAMYEDPYMCVFDPMHWMNRRCSSKIKKLG